MTHKNSCITLISPQNNKIKNTQGIKITSSAKKQILFLTKKNKKKIKLRLKKTGCAGFKYCMEEVVDTSTNLSEIIFYANDVSIIVNTNELHMLDGVKIDFVKEGLNYSFKFSHTKIKNFCGCGNSFEF
ncbi:conserved hypothetical protein [Buchnera aphidicola str. Bp (Baizongia pistaciae)]|uniref:Uncharacterized protein bbp_116 n=1 Tax=Buchnera aphidicola subsp. Baizongia pistaciae (strain Bp) TaxID=224915 RepID=Y116_BUCBP|nr:iron-sulfur cluster assembly accessory protein [Buchnera aphidicola]Q89AW2.1 RecName: Full=Uncharacterized protein bbp_116 [Buchnera aphidicola str. Bp (Baizongia pistaciae)]AAO26850.1 conserved hypothetical protein [Buchnera aphidicola str. Bp (Baizongia pistaciae)]